MRVFNQNKTEELKEYDLEKGYLKSDVIKETVHHDEVLATEGKFHYVTYSNGGRDKVWDELPRKAVLAYYEEVESEIQVYIPYTEEEIEERELSSLRERRKRECFPIINRGKLWYARLSAEQEVELLNWYIAWLNVTETKIIPEKLEWVNSELKYEEEVL